MSVGAKHSGSKYQITTNNLYTGMLRPLLFKTEMHPRDRGCYLAVQNLQIIFHYLSEIPRKLSQVGNDSTGLLTITGNQLAQGNSFSITHNLFRASLTAKCKDLP
jgi:hypothetical protein